MSRPVVGKRKDFNIRVRIDEDTYLVLQRFCNKNGVNMSEAVRITIENFLNVNDTIRM